MRRLLATLNCVHDVGARTSRFIHAEDRTLTQHAGSFLAFVI
jgi:hypothetical protein